jgi:hypothetical protein
MDGDRLLLLRGLHRLRNGRDGKHRLEDPSHIASARTRETDSDEWSQILIF